MISHNECAEFIPGKPLWLLDRHAHLFFHFRAVRVCIQEDETLLMPILSVTQTLLQAQWSAKQIRLPDQSVIDKGLLVLPVSRYHKDHYERFEHSILTYLA